MSAIRQSKWFRVLLGLMALYIMNFVDRNNISFASIGGMSQELKLGSDAIGFAGGIFYLGYMILQIPSGILVERYDAKKLIMLLAATWGLISMSTGFVRSSTELYVLRFLLGLVDGGVYTTTLVVLARWFKEKERATANGIWTTGVPISFILMGPVSGYLISAVGWRALFFVEGIPTIVLAVLFYFVSSSRPEEAKWLSDTDRADLLTHQPVDHVIFTGRDYLRAATDFRVLLFGATYCFWLVGAAGMYLWLPAIIKDLSNQGAGMIGLLSTIPYIAALFGMLLIARISDRTRQRANIVSLSLAALGVSLLCSILSGNPTVSLLFLACGGLFLFSPNAPFWAMVSEEHSPGLRGVVMGTISLIGNAGAFAGPYVVGYIREASHSFKGGVFFLVASLWFASFLAYCLGRLSRSRRDQAVVA